MRRGRYQQGSSERRRRGCRGIVFRTIRKQTPEASPRRVPSQGQERQVSSGTTGSCYDQWSGRARVSDRLSTSTNGSRGSVAVTISTCFFAQRYSIARETRKPPSASKRPSVLRSFAAQKTPRTWKKTKRTLMKSYLTYSASTAHRRSITTPL